MIMLRAVIGETDADIFIFQLEVVQTDKSKNGIMDIRHLHEGHSAVGREESDRRLLGGLFAKESSESSVNSALRNVRDVKNLRRRIDILGCPDSTVFEAMDRRASVVFGEHSGFKVLCARKRDLRVSGERDSELLVEEKETVEMFLAKVGLMGSSVLNHGSVTLVVENLDADHIAVNSKEGEENITGDFFR